MPKPTYNSAGPLKITKSMGYGKSTDPSKKFMSGTKPKSLKATQIGQRGQRGAKKVRTG